MRFRTSLCLATLFLVCFTMAAWSTPLPDQQSLWGQIASVGDREFSVQVKKDQGVNTVPFLVDGQTKVEGQLAMGAEVTVEYRSEEGRNIALRVIVTPGSGMNLY
ncbi:MAG: hypothetical protein DMG56_22570 [Acidobacteria bacterium]|nr:MAG: hypothetical protein DMG56_22570 [Acidobacteriota bacterium]